MSATRRFTPDGWFRTGDLFHVDDEGFHYFTGRRGDMIKTGGRQRVAPRGRSGHRRGDRRLVAHVVGVDDPDRGQVVAAAVRVPATGARSTIDALRGRCCETELSAYKVPTPVSSFLPDDDVPMLSSGKLDTRALQERFGAG